MFAKISNVAIAAIRTAVPGREVRIEDELEYYGGSLKKAARASSMIGVKRRRLAWPGQTASDLCFAAAENLLAAKPEARDSIDALIFVSQTPDYDFPATACILQDRLELPGTCAAFDVNQGCAGFIYGLWLAASLVNSGSRKVLLLNGDVPPRPRDPANRVLAPIFGDGGSATLLCQENDARPLTFALYSNGSGHRHIIMPAGGGRLPYYADFEQNREFFEDIKDSQGNPWRLCDTYMDGKAVFDFTLGVVPEHIRDFLKKAETSPDAIDWFILHQANTQIVTEVAKKAGLPLEKTPCDSFPVFGNLSSASIPAALCHLFGRLPMAKSTRLMLCGYGVGLAWGSCLWETNACDIAHVLELEEPENMREEQIAAWKLKLSGRQDD